MKGRLLYFGLGVFILIDLVLALVYFSPLFRRYPFLKRCPIKSFFCLKVREVRFPRTKAVGFRLTPGEPFYAIADGRLANINVGSGKRLAHGYQLRTKVGITITYIFPVDSRQLPDELPTNRIFPRPEDALGRPVKAGRPIGWMGKKALDKNYHGFNLVIGLVKPGQQWRFPDLAPKDLWGR